MWSAFIGATPGSFSAKEIFNISFVARRNMARRNSFLKRNNTCKYRIKAGQRKRIKVCQKRMPELDFS